jgi:hypothetical protein
MSKSSKTVRLSVGSSAAGSGTAAAAANTEWRFDVKSYHIAFNNYARLSTNDFAAAIFVTDNDNGVTGNGQKHAVLTFFWDPDKVPASGVPNSTGLLHLNFPVADYAGILDLLKSSAALRCFYKYSQKYGGITQINPVPRRL